MKGSDKFKTVIENYLSETVQGDTVFAHNFSKASKNLESCLNYIFGEVKKLDYAPLTILKYSTWLLNIITMTVLLSPLLYNAGLW